MGDEIAAHLRDIIGTESNLREPVLRFTRGSLVKLDALIAKPANPETSARGVVARRWQFITDTA
jgi:hypothetical protein